MTDKQDDILFNDAVKAIRQDHIAPSTDLMNRILHDADQVLARQSRATPAPPPRPLRAVVLEAIGGWRMAGGLVLAAGAGLWIGLAPPTLLTTIAQGTGADTVVLPLMSTDSLIGVGG